MEMPSLKPQEIPYDHEQSNNMFRPSAEKPLLATPTAIEAYSREVIDQCLTLLQGYANIHHGLDYLQVFKSTNGEDLWFIEDGPGGAITALLPSDY